MLYSLKQYCKIGSQILDDEFKNPTVSSYQFSLIGIAVETIFYNSVQKNILKYEALLFILLFNSVPITIV